MALRGVRVIELAGLAPAPFCGMVLADHGANVVRVDKTAPVTNDSMARGKRSISIDLKQAEGVAVVRKLSRWADVLIEPFRPGVMERLGLGPELLCKDNPQLVYARLSGFGQSSQFSNMAGHDINYIATSGVLSRLGRAGEPPYAPINLLADFAGGGMMCAFGIMAALYERVASSQGQVIDCSMTHGSAYISSFLWTARRTLFIFPSEERGVNLLDGGSAFYDSYETQDGKYVAVGAIEPKFYSQLLTGLGLDEEEYPQLQVDQSTLHRVFAERFKSRTLAEWLEVFDGLDACVTGVVPLHEAHKHPQNKQVCIHEAHKHPQNKQIFVEAEDGYIEPTPAPFMSRSNPAGSHDHDSHPIGTQLNTRQPIVGENSVEVLKELGFNKTDIEKLLKTKAVIQNVRSNL